MGVQVKMIFNPRVGITEKTLGEKLGNPSFLRMKGHLGHVTEILSKNKKWSEILSYNSESSPWLAGVELPTQSLRPSKKPMLCCFRFTHRNSGKARQWRKDGANFSCSTSRHKTQWVFKKYSPQIIQLYLFLHYFNLKYLFISIKITFSDRS